MRRRFPSTAPVFSDTNSMQGQELTYAVLSRTRNEAAVEVLLECLDSDLHEHRDLALSTLLQRREDRVPAKLLARWQQLKSSSPSWRHEARTSSQPEAS